MDSFATKKCTIIIIGGSAAALAYNVTEATLDIDSYNNINDAAEAWRTRKKSVTKHLERTVEVAVERVGKVSSDKYTFREFQLIIIALEFFNSA